MDVEQSALIACERLPARKRRATNAYVFLTLCSLDPKVNRRKVGDGRTETDCGSCVSLSNVWEKNRDFSRFGIVFVSRRAVLQELG